MSLVGQSSSGLARPDGPPPFGRPLAGRGGIRSECLEAGSFESAPRIDFHVAALKVRSGARSGGEKPMRAESAASGAFALFAGAPESPNGTTLGMIASYGRRSGFRTNDGHIRVARAS